MNKKISLIYENGKFSVLVNDTIINEESNLEKSIDKFKKIIEDNSSIQSINWENIVKNIKAFDNKEIIIDDKYKTMTFNEVKYFYNTGKVFYIRNGQMTELRGSYNLFYCGLKMILKGKVKSCEELSEFLTKVLENKAVYTINDTKVRVSSPKFNYGFAEYDYVNDKIDKGTSVESGNFEKFKEYVLDRLM
ncbi:MULTISPECIES: hypothetical protein [Clostridium]|uniref:Uncharacterized protein n=1 Tax=Clostridium senegalense TaxID=1465809 RepID=A0A6M0H5A5_9CLOT|nr:MULTISPECIES: hypothetical protein [Clostridium]NEU05809.1 hypothetical protein [Clostridium senegalense]